MFNHLKCINRPETPLIPNRHTAKGGIHGEWSNRYQDRPIRARDLVGAGIVLGTLFLMMSIGAAYGF